MLWTCCDAFGLSEFIMLMIGEDRVRFFYVLDDFTVVRVVLCQWDFVITASAVDFHSASNCTSYPIGTFFIEVLII